MPSSAGGRKGYICPGRTDVYKALRRQGKSKRVAAAISNAGCQKPGRKRMARKAVRTRRAKG